MIKTILIATLSGGLGVGGAAWWTARAAVRVPVTSAASPAVPAAAIEAPPAPGAALEPDAVIAPGGASTVAVTTREASRPTTRSRAPAAPPPSGGAVPPAASAASSPPGATSLDQELSSLHEAQRALKRGDGADALARLDALGERYPDGVLREERLAARVLGLCAAGRRDEARDAGRRFVAENPGSVQVARVRASCAFAPRADENENR